MKTTIIKKTFFAVGAVAILLLATATQAQAVRSSSGTRTSTSTSSSSNRQGAVIMAPNSSQSGDMWVEVNRTGRRATSVTIYRTGDRLQNATLRILDENGNLVRRMSVTDRGARSGRAERSIGTWDLTDMTGRNVRGTFTIDGTVRTQSGRSETVALTFTTRGGGGHHAGEHRGGKRGARVGRDISADTTITVIDVPVVEIIEEAQVVEAVPLPAELPAETPSEIPAEVAPVIEQLPPDPNAQLRSDRDAFFEKLDAAVGVESPAKEEAAQ